MKENVNNSTAAAQEAQTARGFYKLNWLQRIGFGSGDLAQNLIYQTICMYLLFFYTDIYGLDAGAAATMFLVVRLVDVLWDPIVGTYVDKHNPRLGKYRAYLVFAGLPLTAFAILCFWDGFSGSLLYAYITYVGMSMCYTFVNVPYGALNSSLTRDTNEITILTSVRMFMAALYVISKFFDMKTNMTAIYIAQFIKSTGVIVATGYMWALVPEVISFAEYKTGRRISGIVNALTGIFFKAGMALGGVVPGIVLAMTGYHVTAQANTLPKDPSAWFYAMLIYALVGCALLLFCFSQTKERVVMDQKETANVKVSDLWKEFLRNRPLRVLALFFITAFAMMSVGNAAGAYFMNDLELQTPEAQEGIRWLVCVIPAMLLVLAMFIISKYELTDEKVDEINEEIERRHMEEK